MLGLLRKIISMKVDSKLPGSEIFNLSSFLKLCLVEIKKPVPTCEFSVVSKQKL